MRWNVNGVDAAAVATDATAQLQQQRELQQHLDTDLDKVEFVQLGCTSYYNTGWKWRAPDVPYRPDGSGDYSFEPRQCMKACKKKVSKGDKHGGHCNEEKILSSFILN